MFDHEKLDAYRIAIEFAGWVSSFIDEQPRGKSNVIRHLDEASTSIVLNIAEGNGKRSLADRSRFLDIARGSALECAACVDVLVVRGTLACDVATVPKTLLVRIVSTVTKLIERLEQTSTSTSTSTRVRR